MHNSRFSFVGEKGSLPINENDEISKKLALICDVKCKGGKVTEVVKKYGYSRQRFYQILDDYQKEGAKGLMNKKRGPRGNSKKKTICN